ncbi:MAG: potassium channel family protein [Actinomycetota bacterium]|nr:potassium channel family protein [Actinomycetota bacterium]
MAASSALTVTALLAAFALLPFDGEHRELGFAGAVVIVVAMVPMLVRLGRSILVTARPVAEATAAVVDVFTFHVVASASVFYAIAAADEQAFDGLETKIDALYFTVVSMTTVGFGDIAPVSQPARLVTTMQIISTLGFLGGTIRLFSWAARRRLAERDTAEPT